jgi:hypothetical protein
MTVLTSGPFGPGRDPRMPNGDFTGRENGGGGPYGISIDGVWSSLDGQPAQAASRGWGDLSWRFSPFYSQAGGLPVTGGRS